ncbi:hypothetical protein PJE062_2055 [Pseudovibrio sp. JE062]|nr:hypothetical protein PJE062_2055 [Pseudovibrio sp. JE062]
MAFCLAAISGECSLSELAVISAPLTFRNTLVLWHCVVTL